MSSPQNKQGYLHGFSTEEQERLYQQARFLEPRIYENIDFSTKNTLLELGCGVGAQTEILLERFPKLRIQGVDSSTVQLQKAQKHLAQPIAEGRVQLTQADATQLSFPDNAFDAVFICWLLEHVNSPVAILEEARRVMSPGAVIYCTEVLNSTFFLHPYSPETLQYWFAFNDHQWNLGGDPFVGAKLGNYLYEAGFHQISTDILTFHCDNRMPKTRALMIDYWTRLLLSGTPTLLESGKVTEAQVNAMRQELDKLKHSPDSVFFYSAVQARAVAL